MVGAARRGSAVSVATEDGRKRKRFANGPRAADADAEVEQVSWRKAQRRRWEDRGSVSPATRTTSTGEAGRDGPWPLASRTATALQQQQEDDDASPLSRSAAFDTADDDLQGDETAQTRAGMEEERREQMPLRGLKIVVIHVKDTLMDGPPPGEVVLAQLRRYERELRLGCEFLISVGGESVWV